MSSKKSGARRISIAAAIGAVVLAAGGSAGFAGAAAPPRRKARTGPRCRRAPSRGSSRASVVVTNPGTQQSEPNTAATFDLIYAYSATRA